jgi:hypothetical protein
MPVKDDKGEMIRPINFDEFNFRVSLQEEEESFRASGINKFIIEENSRYYLLTK